MKKWLLNIALNFVITQIKKWLKDNASEKTNAVFTEATFEIHNDENNDFKLDNYLN